MTLTLTQWEVENLAKHVGDRDSLRFTELENMRAVKKACKKYGHSVYSRTAHGSLLDPRYTVEGRSNPDEGLANDYKHYHPKLYVLEVSRW